MTPPPTGFGWEKDALTGTWHYSWGAGEANDVVAPAVTNSQNNTSPLGIFNTHVLVKIRQGNSVTLYDPSYGITKTATATNGTVTAYNVAINAALKSYEDQAISYYGLQTKVPQLIGGTTYTMTYLMKSNPTANADADVIRVPGLSTDY